MARTFCLLISITQLLYCGDLFWFSYKAITVNSILVQEEKNISPVMIPFQGKQHYLCSIPLNQSKGLPKDVFLNQRFDDVLTCFYPLATRVSAWSDQRFKHSDEKVQLIIQPIRFTVDFKDEFATINAIR